LKGVFCPNCSLVQITESVSPEILFGKDYPYFFSVSRSLLQHFRESADELIESRDMGSQSMVIEAASHDGHMLLTVFFGDAKLVYDRIGQTCAP
jgi:hypothetical protein